MREHWLEHAHGRIVSGDDELEVLADYGWVQIAADEREAISEGADALYGDGYDAEAATLRKLLARLA